MESSFSSSIITGLTGSSGIYRHYLNEGRQRGLGWNPPSDKPRGERPHTRGPRLEGRNIHTITTSPPKMRSSLPDFAAPTDVKVSVRSITTPSFPITFAGDSISRLMYNLPSWLFFTYCSLYTKITCK